MGLALRIDKIYISATELDKYIVNVTTRLLIQKLSEHMMMVIGDIINLMTPFNFDHEI